MSPAFPRPPGPGKASRASHQPINLFSALSPRSARHLTARRPDRQKGANAAGPFAAEEAERESEAGGGVPMP